MPPASRSPAPAAASTRRRPSRPPPPQVHPRFQPQGRPRAMAMSMAPAEPRPEAFSVSAPAREARGRITGTGYGGAGRITGPVNMASGLVSGTPEFRYRDEAGFMAGRRQAMAEAAAPASPGERITGEGREAGRRITGDDWGRSERVTGTEGRWAQGRNPTLRGAGRSMGASAWSNKDIERPEVPLAKVTGSSGNAGKGALITVSGGARG
ncbi:MAG: CsoS2 family carboxysome shell protein [Pseudomonadota bacterium]